MTQPLYGYPGCQALRNLDAHERDEREAEDLADESRLRFWRRALVLPWLASALAALYLAIKADSLTKPE